MTSQRAASEESNDTKATEESNHVSKQLPIQI